MTRKDAEGFSCITGSSANCLDSSLDSVPWWLRGQAGQMTETL